MTPTANSAFTYKLARSLVPRRRGRGRRPASGRRVRRLPRRRRACGGSPRGRAKASPASSPSIPPKSAPINAAFTPSEEEIAHAAEIVHAFEAQPDAGVLSVGGKMVDRPHLVQAKRVLKRSR